jgi:dTDP-4-dehydrorhamnose 3,5-epimerase
MKFTPTKIAGVWILEMELREDSRGWFARTWCVDEFASHGLNRSLAQCSSSFNKTRGTLRGMHYQAPPHAEAKVVRCTRGAIFDVALDLRPDSATYLQWESLVLRDDNGKAFYIPEGCAHGFQTLEDDTEVFYMNSVPFQPDYGRGCRWDDPVFQIHWPLPEIAHLSDRDQSFQLKLTTPDNTHL